MINPLAVYDIETQDWDTFVVGGVLRRDGVYRDFDYTRESAMVDYLLSLDGDIYAHNGGKFDGIWLLGHLVSRGVKCDINVAGQRIISIAIEGTKTRFLDSAALFPESLDSISEFGSVRKSTVGIPCKCGNECGGYCSISRDMSVLQFAKLREYLEIDNRALMSALDGIAAFAVLHDIELGLTVGGSSWKTARNQLDLPKAVWRAQEWKLADTARFGGRTQVFRPEMSDGYYYDRNSAYPAALVETQLPGGECEQVPSSVAGKAYRDGREGLYHCTIWLPESFIPPLPVRLDKRVYYPYGKLTGMWPANELRYAESCGGVIESFGLSFVWSEADYYLRPYCQRVWDLRAHYGKSSVQGRFLKWLANSLTGKFGQNPDVEAIRIEDKLLVCDYKPCGGNCRKGQTFCCLHHHAWNCKRWKPLDKLQRIWSGQKWSLSACSHVQWGAYLTASNRIEVHKQLISDGQGGMTAGYCDTDSCLSIQERKYRVGENLGDWHFEGKLRDFQCDAPKAYCVYLLKKQNWELVARLKGITLKSQHKHDCQCDICIKELTLNWSKRREGVRMVRGIESFKTAVQDSKVFRRKEMTRQVLADGIHYGDRIRRGELTFPQSMGDITDD